MSSVPYTAHKRSVAIFIDSGLTTEKLRIGSNVYGNCDSSSSDTTNLVTSKSDSSIIVRLSSGSRQPIKERLRSIITKLMLAFIAV